MKTLCVCFVAAALVLAAERASADPSADPAVPPGTNPSGLPVALVGSGLDYTADGISQRLARDGEGEITGFDFVDGDRRPFSTRGDQGAAGVLLKEEPSATLIVVRTDFGAIERLRPSLRFAVTSPARIVALLHPFAGEALVDLVAAVAPHYPRHLFIIEAAGSGERDGSALPEAPLDLKNVLVVTAATVDGQIGPGTLGGSGAADLAVAIEGLTAGQGDGAHQIAPSLAVARMAALAARLRMAEPELSGEDVKARIVGLGEPLPGGRSGSIIRHGWIRAPERHFRLE